MSQKHPPTRSESPPQTHTLHTSSTPTHISSTSPHRRTPRTRAAPTTGASSSSSSSSSSSRGSRRRGRRRRRSSRDTNTSEDPAVAAPAPPAPAPPPPAGPARGPRATRSRSVPSALSKGLRMRQEQQSDGASGHGRHASSLYKTELCTSFTNTGHCRYGSRCQFAHGMDDLRPVVRHAKYKTEPCKNFHQHGRCKYGNRCRFIHTREDVELAAKLIAQQKLTLVGGSGSGNNSSHTNSNTNSKRNLRKSPPSGPHKGPSSAPRPASRFSAQLHEQQRQQQHQHQHQGQPWQPHSPHHYHSHPHPYPQHYHQHAASASAPVYLPPSSPSYGSHPAFRAPFSPPPRHQQQPHPQHRPLVGSAPIRQHFIPAGSFERSPLSSPVVGPLASPSIAPIAGAREPTPSSGVGVGLGSPASSTSAVHEGVFLFDEDFALGEQMVSPNLSRPASRHMNVSSPVSGSPALSSHSQPSARHLAPLQPRQGGSPSLLSMSMSPVDVMYPPPQLPSPAVRSAPPPEDEMPAGPSDPVDRELEEAIGPAFAMSLSPLPVPAAEPRSSPSFGMSKSLPTYFAEQALPGDRSRRGSGRLPFFTELCDEEAAPAPEPNSATSP